MKTGEEPVNPIQYQDGWNQSKIGLTKREYFAALAMQGYCACVYDTALSEKAIARESVRQADALLAELERNKSE